MLIQIIPAVANFYSFVCCSCIFDPPAFELIFTVTIGAMAAVFGHSFHFFLLFDGIYAVSFHKVDNISWYPLWIDWNTCKLQMVCHHFTERFQNIDCRSWIEKTFKEMKTESKKKKGRNNNRLLCTFACISIDHVEQSIERRERETLLKFWSLHFLYGFHCGSCYARVQSNERLCISPQCSDAFHKGASYNIILSLAIYIRP